MSNEDQPDVVASSLVARPSTVHTALSRQCDITVRLPVELWHCIALFLGHQGLLQTYTAWALVNRSLSRIARSDALWLARLKALHSARTQQQAAALTPHTHVVVGLQSSSSASPPFEPGIGTYTALLQLTAATASQRARIGASAALGGTVWNWRRCFLHYFFAVVSQRCVLCCCPPTAANQPICTLYHHSSGRVGKTPPQPPQNQRGAASSSALRGAPVPLEPVPFPSGMEATTVRQLIDAPTMCDAGRAMLMSLQAFPFEGCSVCGICLRKFFWPVSTPQGRQEVRRGRRFYAVNQRRWVVCLRSDVQSVVLKLNDDKGIPYGAAKRVRGSCRGGLRIREDPSTSGTSSSDEDVGAATTTAVPQSQVRQSTGANVVVSSGAHLNRTATPQRNHCDAHSSRMILARAQQDAGEKYLSPSYRAHDAPKDPLGLLAWPGHQLQDVV